VNNLLTKAGKDWNIVKKLIKEKKLVEIEYEENKSYLKKLPG
jgi:hypothetical protein